MIENTTNSLVLSFFLSLLAPFLVKIKFLGKGLAILLSIIIFFIISLQIFNVSVVGPTYEIFLSGISLKIIQIIFFVLLFHTLYSGVTNKRFFTFFPLLMLMYISNIFLLSSKNVIMVFVSLQVLLMISLLFEYLYFSQNSDFKFSNSAFPHVLISVLLFAGIIFFIKGTSGPSLQNISVENVNFYILSLYIFFFVLLYLLGGHPFHFSNFFYFSHRGHELLFSQFFYVKIVSSFFFIQMLQKLILEIPFYFQGASSYFFNYFPLLGIIYLSFLSYKKRKLCEILPCFMGTYSAIATFSVNFESDDFSLLYTFFFLLISYSALLLSSFFYKTYENLKEKDYLFKVPFLILTGYFLISLVGLPFSYGHMTKFIFFGQVLKSSLNFGLVIILLSQVILGFSSFRLLYQLFIEYKSENLAFKKKSVNIFFLIIIVVLGSLSDTVLSLLL